MPHNFAILYATLGLKAQPKPSPEEIRKAYRARALELHPDKNPSDPESSARFQLLSKAYEALLSGCVFIEEEPDQSTATFHDPDGENDVLLDYSEMPKKQRKAAEKDLRKAENARKNPVTRSGRLLNETLRIKKERREDRELVELKEKIENAKKMITNEPSNSAQDQNALSLIPFWEQQVLVLSEESRRRRSRKPLKPDLNSPYHHESAMRTLEADVEESFREERKDEEFIALELPMEFVDPSEEKRTMWLREKLDPKFSETEKEMKENARKLAQKVGNFWDGFKASEERKEAKAVQFVPKMERNPDFGKDASVAYTEQCLETLEKEQSMLETHDSWVETSRDLFLASIPSNMNPSNHHYVSSEYSWGTRKKIFPSEGEDEGKEKDEADEEYRFNERKRMGMHRSRKIAMEHDMLCSDFW
jgi:curved DNA-binding protein CbpA